jgi:hypothetical protein
MKHATPARDLRTRPISTHVNRPADGERSGEQAAARDDVKEVAYASASNYTDRKKTNREDVSIRLNRNGKRDLSSL